MTAPRETSGAAPARCSGPSPARTHDELVIALERERVSYPDELEAERYRPGAVMYVAGVPVRYTPITEEQAARNLARLENWPEKPGDG